MQKPRRTLSSHDAMSDADAKTYPKQARLLKRGEFQRVLGRGEAYPGRQALVRRAANRQGRARLGISTPRGYGKAVQRNTFRRLVREAFRHLQNELGAYDYLVSPRRHLEHPTLEGVRADLLRTRTASPAPPRAHTGGKKRRRR